MPADGIEDLLSQLESVLPVEGNIIECGSSRCGTSIIMANRLLSRGIRKTVYACDSFEGFDRDELRREQASRLTTAHERAFTSTSYRYVQKKIAKLGVGDIMVPVGGFFKDTLPHLNSTFCFALIDCDLRDSLVYCAETLWPRLVSKGRILFDDYTDDNFKGARIGIDHFVDKYKGEIEEHGLLQRLYLVKKA